MTETRRCEECGRTGSEAELRAVDTRNGPDVAQVFLCAECIERMCGGG